MGFKLNPFTGQFDIAGGGSSPTIGSPIVGSSGNSLLGTDASANLTEYILTNGQLLIGSTGSTPVQASITGTTNQVNVTNGAGSITLSLPQSIAITSSPTFANLHLTPSGAIDTTAVGTLAIGSANANVINIGNSGATVNIQGTTLYENVTQLQVTDPLITLNKGGGIGSGSNSGIEIEENSVITGYAETSADRNSWILKAPNKTGIITLSGGTTGFTINQGSHNPVTVVSSSSIALNIDTNQSLTASVNLSASSGTVNQQTVSISYQSDGLLAVFPVGNLTAPSSFLTVTGGSKAVVGGAGVQITLNTQTANTVFAGPTTGSAAAPTFRALVAGDIPSLDTSKITTGTFSASIIGSGQLAVARGGTGVDGSAAANGSLLIGNGSGYTLATLTAGTGISITNGGGSISIANTSAGLYDIGPTTWSGLLNNTANQIITGFTLNAATVSFESLIYVAITATSNTFTAIRISGVRKGADWSFNDLVTDLNGDSITSLAFSADSSGRILISVGNITGFSSAVVKFRAITLS